jgi:hypothetical protein
MLSQCYHPKLAPPSIEQSLLQCYIRNQHVQRPPNTYIFHSFLIFLPYLVFTLVGDALE